jgi:hypothetical protein
VAKVTKVFSMSNPYTQRNSRALGICTAASLAWCRACLKKGRGITTKAELPSDHTLNAQMATLRRYDSQPARQAEMAGLELVREWTVGSIDEVFQNFKGLPPHTGIFWTLSHTMGYRYAHRNKEFFDVESGLYRATKTSAIRDQITKDYAPGEIAGCYIVKLP